MDNAPNHRYSIVVVSYNSSADIGRCIESVKRHTSSFELIVVDNASRDNTPAILKNTEGIEAILNSTNLGFSAATNQGIRASKGDYIILLNPDTEVFPLWADRMADKFESLPGVGAVGPMSTNCLSFQSIYSVYPEIAALPLSEIAEKVVERGSSFKDVPILIGFCLMVSRRVLNHVGLLDERLFLGNDDLDLSWRLRLHGYRLIVACDAFIAHEMQKSFKTEPKETTKKLVQESTDALYRKLVRRYGKEKLPSSRDLWSIEWFTPSESVKTEKINGPETRLKLVFAYSSAPSLFFRERIKEYAKLFDITEVMSLSDVKEEHDAFVWFHTGDGDLSINPTLFNKPSFMVCMGGQQCDNYYKSLIKLFNHAVVTDYRLFESLRNSGIENISYMDMEDCFSVGAEEREQLFDVAYIGDYHGIKDGVRGEYIQSLASISSRRRLFIGNIEDPNECRKVIAASRIIIDLMPIGFSGFSKIAIEAMALGKAVFSNAWDTHCPIQEFNSGVHFVPFNSSEMLISKIEYYLEHDTERVTIGNRAMERVRETRMALSLAFRFGAVLREAMSLHEKSGQCSTYEIGQDELLCNKICEFKKGIIHKSKKEYQSAKRAFLHALEINAGNAGEVDADCHLHYADIALIENNLRECITHLEAVPEQFRSIDTDILETAYFAAINDKVTVNQLLAKLERKYIPTEFGCRVLPFVYEKLDEDEKTKAAFLRGYDSVVLLARLQTMNEKEVGAIINMYAKKLSEEILEKSIKLKDENGSWLPYRTTAKDNYDTIDLSLVWNADEAIKESSLMGRRLSVAFRNAQSLSFIESLGNVNFSCCEYTYPSVENLLSRNGYQIDKVIMEESGEVWNTLKAEESVRVGRLLLKRIDYTDTEWNRFFIDRYVIHAVPRIYKEVSSIKVSIVMLTFNQKEYTEQCINSIWANSEKGSFELIIVDNASRDGTQEWLAKEKKAGRIDELVLNSENRGVSAGWNQGIAIAKGGYVLIFNNDTIVPKNWLRNMLRCAESADDIGMVGPMSNSISGLQLEKDSSYTSVHEFHEFAAKYMRERDGHWWELFRIVGFCMLIKKSVIDKIGVFDERFGKGNFEDDDYCIRVRRAGYRIMVAGDSFIHHFGGVSFDQAGVDWKEQMRKNELLFREKWAEIDAKLIASRKGDGLDAAITEAEAAIEKGDYPRAVHLLVMVLEKDTKNYRAYNDMGIIAWQKGNVADAEKFFKESLKYKVDFVDAVFNLLDAYSLRGAVLEEEKLLKEAIKLFPDNAEIAERLSKSKATIKQSADDSLSIVLDKADILLEENKHKEAEALYLSVLSKYQDNFRGLNGIGLCAWYDGRNEDAYWFFRKAVEHSPSDEDAVINFVDAALVLGRYGEARKVLVNALQLNPKLKDVSRMLSDIDRANDKKGVGYNEIIAARELNIQGERLLSEGLIDKAETKFKEILAAIPDHFVAANNLALCEWYRGNIESAYKKFIESLDISPAYEDALVNLFDASLKLKKVNEVVSYFERALRINPALKDARNILNQIKLRQEKIYELKYYGQLTDENDLNKEGHKLLEELKLTDATHKFIESIEKNGDNCESYCGLGIVQFYRNEYEDAFRLFSHAVELNPLSEDALLNLYDTALKINRVEYALRAMQNAIDVDPALTRVNGILSGNR